MSFDSPQQLITVAVPRPVYQLYTYLLPAHLASSVQLGTRVKVPFGSSRTDAFVVEPPKALTEIPNGLKLEALKSILEVESSYIIPDDVFALCRWAQEYYCAPLGEVLACAAPSLGAPSKRKSRPEEPEITQPVTLPLTEDQSRALSEIGAGVTLLHGVTGSGKTEVYIEAARKTLAQGGGVLILVPEIALTPQLHRRFENRLGIPVGLWHSAVAKGKKQEQIAELLSGKLRVVVGVRSAVFAPVRKLGLIVVDEEHDATYKQEDRFRYQARDLAIVRAKMSGAQVILGSATPSLETRERVREGKFQITKIDRRVTPVGLPRIELVDLCEEETVPDIQAPLALSTVKAIQETLQAGEQVLIYLNRRGFAAFLLCRDCGEVSECPQCSISLTVHKRDTSLRCHQCGYSEATPLACDKCHGTNLFAMGAGTESLEMEIPALVSGTNVLRLDRDQITSTRRLNQVLNDFRKGKANILLGTQMLVKGHDFPGVTLVVVILADALFRWPDFRASERAYQILKQVSGRAGRHEKSGRVLIQTFDVEHPVLRAITGEMSEESFLESERQLRLALSYPPFGRLARIRFENPSRAEAIRRSEEVARYLRENEGGALVLGPSEAFLEKIRGVYRWDLLIKSKEFKPLYQALLRARDKCLREKWPFLADVDPSS